MSSKFEYYLEFGKSTGLSGTELVQFAKDSVSLDRENRLAEREALQSQRLLDLEFQEREMKLKQDAEKLRLDKETQSKLALMEKEKELQMLKLEETRLKSQTEVRIEELHSQRDTGAERLVTQSMNGNSFRNLNVGFFDNQPESLDGFISRFETICRAYKVEPEIWGVEFSRCLTGQSLEVYNFLDSEGKLCYDTIINSLRKRWGITAGS